MLVVVLASSGMCTLRAEGARRTAGWQVLECMSQAERDNARIDLELTDDRPKPVRELARQIEELWNSGGQTAALALFPALERVTVGEPPAVGIAWREPIPSPELTFNPFAVGTRDSVYVVDFEVDWRLTRRFFCALAIRGDGAGSRLSVNHSTDLGRTWSEVFILSGYNYEMNDIAGRIMLGRYWLVYTGGANTSPNHALWCRQFDVSDGSADTFLSGSVSDNFFNTPAADTVQELAMVTNQLPANGTVYLFARLASDSLRYFSMPTNNDTAWRVTNLTFANAAGGLDACWNDGWLSSDTSLMFVSYATRTDSVCILREILGGTWQRYRVVAARPRFYATSVAAHRDTVICAYSDDGRIRYQIRRGYGSWAYGEPPQDTTLVNTMPDLCAQGGYFHCVYRASTGNGWYTRRPCSGYTWEGVRQFDAGLGVAYGTRPDVRWIGRGDTAGVTWICLPTGSGRAQYAYFDYSGISESSDPESGKGALDVRPGRRGAVVSYTLVRPGCAQLSVSDAAGRETYRTSARQRPGRQSQAVELPGPGVYFLRLLADGRESVVKFVHCR
jgi:hypothetical protein